LEPRREFRLGNPVLFAKVSCRRQGALGEGQVGW
jgi:hypothetical protein